MNVAFYAEIPRGGINFHGQDSNEIQFSTVEIRVDYEPGTSRLINSASTEPNDQDQIMAIHCHDKQTGKLIHTSKHEDEQLETLAWQYIENMKKGVAA